MHPTKAVIARLLGNPGTGEAWTSQENELKRWDSITHLGIVRAWKKGSEINITERISPANIISTQRAFGAKMASY